MTDLLRQPGFPGTKANFVADMTSVTESSGRNYLFYRLHPCTSRPLLNAQMGADQRHNSELYFAFFFGNFVVLRGHRLLPQRLRFKDYKAFMRTAYGLYLATTALGVWTYISWFVTTSKPPVF